MLIATKYESRFFRSYATANRLIVACVLGIFSQTAYPFAFGNIKVHSSLGQAFVAQVDISTGPGESVDEFCLRLIPSKSAGNASSLPSARLTVTPSAKGGTLHIHSRDPINEPTVQIILEATCPGVGRLQREYVVLLDPSPLSVPLTAATSIDSPRRAKPERAASTSQQVNGKKKRKTPAPSGAVSGADKPAYKASAKAQPKSSPPPRSKTPANGGFRLKLSAPEIDLSHIETLTEEQRKELRDQQALMDSDDQLASLLTTRHKLKELEERLAALQLKLSTIAPSSATQEPQAPQIAPQVASPPEPEVASPSVSPAPPEPSTPEPVTPEVTEPASSGPADATEQLSTEPERSPLSQAILAGRRWLIFVLILAVLTFIAIRLLRRPAKEPATTRRYDLNESASRTSDKGQKSVKIAPAQNFSPVTTPSPSFDVTPPPPAPATNPKEAFRNAAMNKFPELKSAGNTEARTIISVAWQYFEDKGERGHAIELIEFGLEEHPDVDDLWLTQFEFLLRDRRVSDYEKLARRYRERFPTDQGWIKIQSWIQIQSGGRYLDPDNSLYAVEAIADNEAKVLTLDFDPATKKHAEPGN